jgi:hypothetical protein
MAIPNTAVAPPGLNVVTPSDYYDGIIMVQNTVYPAGKAFMNATAAAYTVTVVTKAGSTIVFASIPAGAIIPLSITTMTSATANLVILY